MDIETHGVWPFKGLCCSFRSAVCGAPCNERGGPRYDMDDGAANSAFTSGLRSTGAQAWAKGEAIACEETNEAAQRRVRQSSLRGPERFFYDRTQLP